MFYIQVTHINHSDKIFSVDRLSARTSMHFYISTNAKHYFDTEQACNDIIDFMSAEAYPKSLYNYEIKEVITDNLETEVDRLFKSIERDIRGGDNAGI